MTNDLLEQAYNLRKEIEQMKATLKEKEDDLRALLYEIQHTENISSSKYILNTRTIRHANPEWYRRNAPKFYRKFSHVSHPNAVALMSDISGGYESFMDYIREKKPEEFCKKAIISTNDIKEYFGMDRIDELISEGAIVTETKLDVLPKIAYEMQEGYE